jgi:hypothetical protein
MPPGAIRKEENMAQVRVRNLHSEEHVEKFRGKVITIPPGGTIEMGRAEAVKFLSQWSPPIKDGTGRHLYPKKLKLEQDPEAFAEQRDQPLKYDAPDGKRFRTPEGLENYIESLKGGSDTGKPGEVASDKPQPRRRATARNGAT